MFSLGLRIACYRGKTLSVSTQCPVNHELLYSSGLCPAAYSGASPEAVSLGSSLMSATLSSGFWLPWSPRALSSVSSTREFAGSHVGTFCLCHDLKIPSGQ